MLDSVVRFEGSLLQQHDLDYLTDTNHGKLSDMSFKMLGLTIFLLEAANFFYFKISAQYV